MYHLVLSEYGYNQKLISACILRQKIFKHLELKDTEYMQTVQNLTHECT